MAFVYEEVGEENRELWESLGWKDWDESEGCFFKTGKWCIDREKEAYLRYAGQYRDTPFYYDLSYKGRIIRMEETCRIDTSREEGNIIPWKIKGIKIPKSVWEEKDNIIQMIIEAFTAVKRGNPTRKVLSVTVEIQDEPECVEADYNGN